MKKLILILVIVFPFLANGQDYRVVDWKTDVLNVQTVGIDTFKFDAEPKDYNDAGAITREIGNYFIDYVARCFKIIDSDANTITVVDLEHINSAPQSNQIGRVYQSVVDADSLFESIGGVDISVLDQMSIYRDVARNNEIICRLLKELYLKDATYRQKSDHDSLSALDEKSYNSLTDKPDLTSYRQKTDHDSLSALDEKSYNSLTDKPASLPASDVYPWAKAATKPTYTYSEVGAQPAGSYATTTQLADQLSQTINNGITTKAPSEDAVYDALAGKASISGTTGYFPIITGVNTLGNSMLYDNSGNLMSTGSLFINKSSGAAYNLLQSPVASITGVSEVAYFVLNNTATADKVYVGLRKKDTNHEYIQSIFNASSNMWISFGNYNYGTNNYIAYDGVNNVHYKNNFTGFGTPTPAARVHSQSTTTQARFGYDANKYTDLTTNSAGTFNISPSGGFTNFSGGISATAFSTFSGQVEMTGLDVNLGASTVLRKNGSDVFTAPITMGACGSAGQVLSSTGPNSAPIWTTPATGSGSGITSIGIQVPTGLTVSPASLTANGTFTFGLQSGYSIPTTANQTNWSTAYSQRLISVSASYPMYLSLTNNVLTGYLHQRLVDFANANQSVGYLYWNGSAYSYQAATTTYTLPTASNSTLGGIQVSSTDGGLAMVGNYLLQKDNVLTTRTPVLSDPIAFYDASATAQGQTTFAEIRTIMNGVQTLTSASSITMNFATAPKGSLALGTSATLTITNVPDGGEGSIEVTSSGAYTLAIAGSTGYTTTQKMGTVSAIASTAHTTVFYWRSGSTLYYGFLLNN